jgi:three-Cys-motif partner protein
MKKTDAKTTMLLHSEAKVEFFRNYLERYIRILALSGQFREINIFDVFCGTGIYENGKKGSPIAAFDVIKEFREQHPEAKSVAINLYVNDSASNKVEAVKSYIDAENVNHCNVQYTSKPADEILGEIGNRLPQQGRGCHNLVFIDPYGYKEIDRASLERLLANGRTEVILFLPISHMQRFTAKAIESDEAPYIPLKRFVASFFPSSHPIHSSTLSSDDYIRAVREALKFGRYYSTSFVIERDSSNQYAVFFMTRHIYGYEKILEVKWKMDEDEGRGFGQPDPNPTFSLFAAEEKVLAKEENYRRLEKLLADFLGEPRTNRELYEQALELEFLPKHANEVFKRWQESGDLEVTDAQTGKPARKGGFYLSWDSYRQHTPRARFNLKKS